MFFERQDAGEPKVGTRFAHANYAGVLSAAPLQSFLPQPPAIRHLSFQPRMKTQKAS
jgi:hypothetical protein